MKKLLFVIPTMRVAGAERSLVNLANLLVDKYKVSILLFDGDNGLLVSELSDKINILTLSKSDCAMLLEFRYYFKYLLKEFKIKKAFVRIFSLIRSKLSSKASDKQYVLWSTSKKYIRNIEGEYDIAVGYLEGTTDFFVIDKINAKKKIGWIHSNFALQKRNYKYEYEYYKQFYSLATISDVCKNSFVNIYPDLESKISVIENIFDVDTIIKKSNEYIKEIFHYKDALHIVTVGRLEHVKGPDIAVDACKILKKRGVKLEWHILGDGVMRNQLYAQIEKLELSNMFFLDGVIENPYPYIKKANIIVQPSRCEGKSIALDEAKVLGKPIIVTNYPSAKDQITDGYNGIITAINSEDIANAIEKLWNDKQLMKTISENAETIVGNKEKVLEGFENLIK